MSLFRYLIAKYTFECWIISVSPLTHFITVSFVHNIGSSSIHLASAKFLQFHQGLLAVSGYGNGKGNGTGIFILPFVLTALVISNFTPNHHNTLRDYTNLFPSTSSTHHLSPTSLTLIPQSFRPTHSTG